MLEASTGERQRLLGCKGTCAGAARISLLPALSRGVCTQLAEEHASLLQQRARAGRVVGIARRCTLRRSPGVEGRRRRAAALPPPPAPPAASAPAPALPAAPARPSHDAHVALASAVARSAGLDAAAALQARVGDAPGRCARRRGVPCFWLGPRHRRRRHSAARSRRSPSNRSSSSLSGSTTPITPLLSGCWRACSPPTTRATTTAAAPSGGERRELVVSWGGGVPSAAHATRMLLRIRPDRDRSAAPSPTD